MQYEFIGDSYLYCDPINLSSIALENGKEYDVEIKVENPQITIVNGRAIEMSNNNIWIIIDTNEGIVQIPHSKSGFENNWKQKKPAE